ncbi:MAG: c-type cytochrome [Sandaracinaceae bacterium]|nr:c-type cytochrome [Sandaracinaceae bacterium]
MRKSICALGAVFVLAGCPEPGPPPVIPDDIFAPLGEIAPFATEEQRATFERGRAFADHDFTIEEGLGPHFNLSSCAGCHERPVTGGSGPRYRNFLLIAQDVPDGPLNFLGVKGIQPQFEVDAESRYPTPEGVDVAAGRNAIPFFGAGLMAEIPGESILRNEDPDDADGDGISGRANYDQGFVGRFGRKSQTVSVEGFIRGPLFNHLGMTSNPLSAEMAARLPVPSVAAEVGRGSMPLTEDVGANVQAQAAAPASPITDDDDVPDPEISEQDLFDLVSFAMLLAAPQPDAPTPQSTRGEEVFSEMRCDACHVHTLESPRGLVPLYSDLLLHDMGPELADGIRMGIAMGNEFRTQPLWGVSAVGPFLHDGRADTLDEAIRMHGGEGQAAADAYAAADDADRAAVIAFLESLGGLSQRSEGLIPPGATAPPVAELGGPMAGTDAAMFEHGRRVFDGDFGLDRGLGPGFNGDSCRACHFLGEVGGAGTIDVNVTRQGISDGATVAAPSTGTMAHRHSRIPSQRPPLSPDSNFFELRQTPPLFGFGLIDQIPEAVVMANADPDDLDGDGVRGRPHVLGDGRLGRFGWKANVPSVAEFTRDALFNEMGVSLPDQPGLTFGGATDADEIPDPEMQLDEIEALSFFIGHLAPPPRAHDDVALEDMGEALFETVGCASCHRTLALEDGTPVVLYSDLLLHDVFPDGALGIGDGDAGGRELRTPPLWGLHVSGPYMHDGRSGTVEDAIARHFGEASASATAFAGLSAGERAAVLAFLASL